MTDHAKSSEITTAGMVRSLMAVQTATGNSVGLVGANRILATPEMQAIKDALERLAWHEINSDFWETELPASVREWVGYP